MGFCRLTKACKFYVEEWFKKKKKKKIYKQKERVDGSREEVYICKLVGKAEIISL